MPRCVPRSGLVAASLGSPGSRRRSRRVQVELSAEGTAEKTCKTGCNNIWPTHVASTTETNAGGLKLSTTERTISSGSLTGPGTAASGLTQLMEIVGRPCQTPIREHRLITTFHRNRPTNRPGFVSHLDWSGRSATRNSPEDLGRILRRESLSHVQRLLDFGPRPAGSKSLENRENTLRTNSSFRLAGNASRIQ